jgi:hypothetical protein
MSANSVNPTAGDATAVDRRAFLALFGALVVASIAPLAVARPRLAPSVSTEAEWDVDDICGHSPRYAHPIPHAPARSSPVMWECVDPIDRMLV